VRSSLPAFLAVSLLIFPSTGRGADDEPASQSLSYDGAIERMTADLFTRLDPRERKRCACVAVRPFSYRRTGHCGAFGELIAAELPASISKTGAVAVATGGSLEPLEEQKALWSSDLVNPATVPRLSDYSAVTGLVRGTYFYDAKAKTVRVTAELVEVSTAQVLAFASVTIAAGTLPIAIDEQELAAADALAGKLRIVENAVKETAAEDADAPKISVWTADGRAVYSQGEKIVFSFRSDRDCYLRLFNIRPDGSALMIFPNEFQRNCFIKGGQTYRIPDADAHFEFLVTPPYGPEAVLALATTSMESNGVLTRGLPGPNEKSETPFAQVPRGVEGVAKLARDAGGPSTRGVMAAPAGTLSEARIAFSTENGL